MPADFQLIFQACPKCNSLLPADRPPGHCPACLVRVTLLEEEFESAPLNENTPSWTTLGDCELYEELGRGGMGIVYRARHRRLGRQMAVKVLRGGELAEPSARRRFQAEAETVAQLQHPGIITIHDVGEEQGVYWYSMEFVPGQTLDEIVRQQPMLANEAAACLCDISEAVKHAHQHGILHRDLKPSNIILDAEGNPRVTDFGIARRTVGGTAAHTRSCQILGSPGYVAPELSLEGRSDERTDVYGLGALLYHLLTGRPPFQGPTLDSILIQLRESEPLPPHRLNPMVPQDLETICLKCLDRNPLRRYSSAQALIDDLTRFLNEESIAARPRSWLEHGAHWMVRHWGIALAAFITTSALIASTLISRRDAATSILSAKLARESEQEARRLVYTHDMERAQAELLMHNLRGAEILKEHVPSTEGERDQRGWEWFYLNGMASGARLINGDAYGNIPAMAPDGLHFAQGCSEGGINIWETATRRLCKTIPTGKRRITNVQWMSDSRRLTSCSFDADIRMHDTWDGALLVDLPRCNDSVSLVSWSPTGAWFAHLDFEGEAVIRSAAGEILHRTKMATADLRIACHALLPQFILYSRGLRTFRMVDLEHPQDQHEWPVEHELTALTWQPREDNIALAQNNGALRLQTSDKLPRIIWQRSLAEASVTEMQFTVDGKYLVLGLLNGAIKILRATDGQEENTLVAHASPGIYSLSVAEHAGISLGKNGDLRQWDVHDKASEDEHLKVDGAVKSLTWSEDDRYLKVCSVIPPTDTASSWQWWQPVWDRQTHQWMDTYASPHPGMAEWSPDGKLLARVVRLNTIGFITVEEFPNGNILHRLRLDMPVADLKWNHEGTLLAVSCPPDKTIICNLASETFTTIGAYTFILESPKVRHALEWSPDDRTILICDKLWHYDVQTSSPVSAWMSYDNATGSDLAVCCMAWNSQTGEIAMGRETGVIEIRAHADGHILRRRHIHANSVRVVYWHPKERRLVTSSNDGMVKLLDAETLEELLVWRNTQPDVRAMAWSHDGLILSSGAADGSIILRSCKPELDQSHVTK